MTDDPAALSKLHDIVTPPDVSWWPLAPGWMVLLTVAAFALCYYAYRIFLNWKKNAYRREALEQLNAADTAVGIAEVLKRTALAIAPREEVAKLDGSSWIDWLGKEAATKPTQAVCEILTRSNYEAEPPSEDLTSLREFAGSWIRNHQNPC
ncbi:DUF4381 domain-containing protein [Haloferula sp.]|uniref:DUF4381 domain-containing protein n=1 Tax=Haloferula sp. TaxID=2497595 RepID=UPI003C72AD82